jgi:hypothetical protein
VEGNNDRPWVHHDRPWVTHYAAWVNHDASCPWADVENNTLEVTSAGRWAVEILATLLNTEARIEGGSLSGDTRIGKDKDPAAPTNGWTTSHRNYC